MHIWEIKLPKQTEGSSQLTPAIRELFHFAFIFLSMSKLSSLLDDDEGDFHRGGGESSPDDLSNCLAISEA